MSPLILKGGSKPNEENIPRTRLEAAKRESPEGRAALEAAMARGKASAQAYNTWLALHPRPRTPDGWEAWEKESQDAKRECGMARITAPLRCHACKDTGWTRRDNVIIPCPDCSNFDREHSMKRAAQLPETRWNDTFESFNLDKAGRMGEAYQAALDFCEATALPWLVLAGQIGCGKTHLAYSVANRLITSETLSEGTPLHFWVVADLMEAMRGVFNAHQNDPSIIPQQEFDKMTYEPRVLILDDLGAEVPTDWVGEELFRIIDKRYREGRGLLVTTNVNINKMPPRIASRFQDPTMCQIVVCKSPDYRPNLVRRGGPTR